MIVTKTDYVNYFALQQDDPIWSVVKSFLAKYSILFIGYSLEDENVRSIFTTIDEKMQGCRNRCYFVSPCLPKHRQYYLSKKNIQYIDMTGEEIIPRIHREIQKHLIEDLKKGYVQYTAVCKILQEHNINANFNIQSDGTLYLKSIQCSDSIIQCSIEFNNDHQLPIGELQELMHGLSFDSVKLNKGSILGFKTFLKGFELPIASAAEHLELELKAIPRKTFDCSFLLKNNEIDLNNIKGAIYCSKYLLQIKFEHQYVSFSYKYKALDGNAAFDFETVENIDVIQAKKIYDFLNKWLQGDEIIILNHDGIKIPNLPSPIEIADDLKFKVDYLSGFYSDLFEIQKYFGVVFNNISEITENDLDNIISLLAAIRQTTLRVDNVKMKITPTTDDFEKSISEEKFSVKFVMKMPEKIKLFGQIFTLKEGEINCTDAYVVNKKEVIDFCQRGKIPIPIVMKSRGNGLDFTWII